MYFPVVDIELEMGMNATGVFEAPTSGEYTLNPMYCRSRSPVEPEIGKTISILPQERIT
jgi:hypothetical protein